MKISGSSKTITCPLCKDESDIPSGGIKRIKNNYFIADLVERINKIEIKPSRREVRRPKEFLEFSELDPIIYCKSHVRNVIDQYCVDCDLAACGTCLLQDHRHHNLVDLEEQATISIQQLQDVLQQTYLLIYQIDDKIQDSKKHEKQSRDDIKSLRSYSDNMLRHGRDFDRVQQTGDIGAYSHGWRQ